MEFLVLKKSSNNNILFKPIILLAFVGFTWIIFNKFGLLQRYYLQQEKLKLEKEISTLINEEKLLRSHIERLNTDFDYVEKIAYEKYKMVKPGEKIYKVKERRKSFK